MISSTLGHEAPDIVQGYLERRAKPAPPAMPIGYRTKQEYMVQYMRRWRALNPELSRKHAREGMRRLRLARKPNN